jgi:NO-binding membrane sensor protein with MHYT domain
MRVWALLLGGLVVWATHFFALYAIGSVLPEALAVARLATLLATGAAITADILLLRAVRRRSKAGEDELDRWIHGLAAAGAMLSLVAVLWQGLPALIL